MGIDIDRWVITSLVVGEFQANCIIIGCQKSREAIVIDPGDEAPRIMRELRRNNLAIKYIINTHGHADHIGANHILKELTGVPIMIGSQDADMLLDPNLNLSAPFGFNITSPPADNMLKEGDTIEFGELSLKVLETPGHSNGSITLVGENFAVVGDLIFSGSVGRTDFPGGDHDLLIRMIKEKIFTLGDDYILYPGHYDATTIGHERKTNPFLIPSSGGYRTDLF